MPHQTAQATCTLGIDAYRSPGGGDQRALQVTGSVRQESSLRVTEVAGRLGIDTPAVTRKAQQLERLGLPRRSFAIWKS